ncbi:adhesin, partial [Bacillus thuringiensis]
LERSEEKTSPELAVSWKKAEAPNKPNKPYTPNEPHKPNQKR